MTERSGVGESPLVAPFTAVGPSPTTEAFVCPLCSCRFDHGGRACGSCPMSTGCDLVKCPHCGFQFPRASRLLAWVKRFADRMRGPP